MILKGRGETREGYKEEHWKTKVQKEGGGGGYIIKQQTTQKKAIPAPDRPASCVPKCFFLISVQRQQGRDSKPPEEGGKRGVWIVGLLQKAHP